MTAIGDLLNDKAKHDLGFVVTKAATDPNPPRRPLALSDAIEIDPESEALLLLPCVDFAICQTTVPIEPGPPEGVDPEMPRVPICPECHDVRVREAKEHGWLVRHVTRTPTRSVTTIKQEAQVPDLDTMTDAALGAAARQSVKETIAKDLPAKRDKAVQAQRKADAQAKAEIAEQQAERKGKVLPEVTIGVLTVPALDLSEITDLSLMPSDSERDPYNRVLHHLGVSILDPETTTYGYLAQVHELLVEHPQPETTIPVDTDDFVESGQILAADLEPEAKAKTKAMVKAIRKVRPELSKEQAKAIVASL